MTEWVRLKRYSDWGAIYFAEEGKGLGPHGTSDIRKYALALTGSHLRVRWPDGSVSIEEVTSKTHHDRVSDMGREYPISFPLDGVAYVARGVEQWIPLDGVDIDRESLTTAVSRTEHEKDDEK